MSLLSAPAGFGKTTLVTEWLENLQSDSNMGKQDKYEIAWLSLDASDNNLRRFLTYFIAALQHANNGIGDTTLSMLKSSHLPPTKVMMTSLINEIDGFNNKIVFVLDDFHLIEDPAIYDSLSFLIENLPHSLHLVIVTREDPLLPLARLMARDQMTELRARDLRFTKVEVADFLNRVMGLDLSEGDIAALDMRTEGWIAGLQLAALSMQGRNDATKFIKSFTGSHRLVLDYLIEEALDQQPKNIQNFLLRTSILDRLRGTLCNALTGQDNSQHTMEYLEQANLFIIPLDNVRQWYRYHHLFADVLQARLVELLPDQVSSLHHRASTWYEKNGFTDEAIEHALQSGNFERAASLIEDYVDVVWERGEHQEIWRWISGLPDEVILSKPQLCIYQAWKQFTNGQQTAAEASLQAAENAVVTNIDTATETTSKTEGRSPGFDERKIMGRAASIRAHLAFYRGDLEETKKFSREALEFLPKRDKSWRLDTTVSLGDAYSVSGDLSSAFQARSATLEASLAESSPYMVLSASVRLAMTMRMLGKLDEVLEICQRQMDALKASGLTQIAILSVMLAIWGEVLAEKSDLDVALQRVREGEVLALREKDVGNIGWSYLCLMRVLFSKGDYAGVQEYINKMNEALKELQVPNWIAYRMADWQVRIWLAQDRLDAADQWVSDRDLAYDGEFTYINERQYIALVRILMAHKHLDKATSLLQRLLDAQELSGHLTKTIQILILLSLTYYEQDNSDQAFATLEKALALAEPAGYFRIFVDEGQPMARMLYDALSREIAPDYVQKLLAAFPTERQEKKSQEPDFEWIEPLSEREIEVLVLIAEGLTNQEISGRLYVSLNTVKAHTRNIYSKIGVNNRTHAVSKARTLGILQKI